MNADQSLTPQMEALVAAVGKRPLAMVNLARTLLLPKGKVDRARALVAEALALAPDDPEVRAVARPIRTAGIGSWYYTMVQDHDRHALYAQAFRALFTPGCTVLDIGAGTGLFAMLAAREGAGHVIACERDPAVAQAAERIVAANGYADRVTMLSKDSRALEIGVDLPARADVLLWDNLANNLLGAGAAATIEDAKHRLLKPGAPVIPARAEIVVGLLGDERLPDRMMGEVDGFDMTPFNDLRLTNFTANRAHFPLRSTAAALFDIDVTRDEALTAGRGEVQVSGMAGTVYGIGQWLRFHLAPGIVYDTSGETVSAFGTQFHAIEPFEVADGQTVTICGAHDRESSWFWIADDGSSG